MEFVSSNGSQKLVKIFLVEDRGDSLRNPLEISKLLSENSADGSIQIVRSFNFFEAYWYLKKHAEEFDVFVFDIVLTEGLETFDEALILQTLKEEKFPESVKNKWKEKLYTDMSSLSENDRKKFIFDNRKDLYPEIVYRAFSMPGNTVDELDMFGGLYLAGFTSGFVKRGKPIFILTGKGKVEYQDENETEKEEGAREILGNAFRPFSVESPFVSEPFILGKGGDDYNLIIEKIEEICLKKAKKIFRDNPEEARNIRKNISSKLDNQKWDKMDEVIQEYKVKDVFTPYWGRRDKEKIKEIIFSGENHNQILTRLFKKTALFNMTHNVLLPSSLELEYAKNEVERSNLPEEIKKNLIKFLKRSKKDTKNVQDKVIKGTIKNPKRNYVLDLYNEFVNDNNKVLPIGENFIPSIHISVSNKPPYCITENVKELVSSIKQNLVSGNEGKSKSASKVEFYLFVHCEDRVFSEYHLILIGHGIYFDFSGANLFDENAKGGLRGTLNQYQNECRIEFHSIPEKSNGKYQICKYNIRHIEKRDNTPNEFGEGIYKSIKKPFTIFDFIFEVS